MIVIILTRGNDMREYFGRVTVGTRKYLRPFFKKKTRILVVSSRRIMVATKKLKKCLKPSSTH